MSALTEQKIDMLEQATMWWYGTPFRANACSVGRGVSCQKLVAALYREIGYMDIEPPEVAMDHHMQCRESIAEQYVDALGNFSRVDEPQPGDLLGFRIGKVVHHLGIALRNRRFVHCLRGIGVTINSLDDPTWSSRLAVIWRPL